MKPINFLILNIAVLHLAPILRLLGVLPFGRSAFVVVSGSVISVALAMQYVARSRSVFTRLDWCVLGYISLCVVSAAAFFQPHAPSEPASFLYGIHYVLLPISGFFAIKMFGPKERQLILKVLIGLVIFAQVFGIYLYYARPNWYSAALEDIMFAIRTDDMSEDWRKFARMQSYLGSTSVGTLSAATILALMLLKNGRTLFILGMPFSVISVLLCKQRGGLVATLFALVVFVASEPKRILSRVLFLGSSLAILIIVLERFELTHVGMIDSILERGSEMRYVWEYRGYGPGVAYLSQWPLGVGLGATLSATDSAGLASQGQVVDANFMRIAADLGIQGLLLFGVMVAVAYHTALKSPQRLISIGLISVFMIVCTGTNTLDTHMVSHYFWFFLGFIDAESASHKLRNRKEPILASPVELE
jgi:hypothetical protein